MTKWLPFVGWRKLSRVNALELDLNVNYEWETFDIEWLGRGFTICARTV